MRRLLLAVLCAAVAAGAASSSGAERSWVIQGDTVIGGYLVQKDGTLFGAIRQFGPPTSKRRDLASGWNGCAVTWKSLGRADRSGGPSGSRGRAPGGVGAGRFSRRQLGVEEVSLLDRALEAA